MLSYHVIFTDDEENALVVGRAYA